jgi:diacylglycerol O-acyltransferase / wax synthase
MMKRLTGLDGLTLHGETSVMPTHVLAVLFCDPAARGELTARAVLELLGRMANSPNAHVCRSRIR